MKNPKMLLLALAALLAMGCEMEDNRIYDYSPESGTVTAPSSRELGVPSAQEESAPAAVNNGAGGGSPNPPAPSL